MNLTSFYNTLISNRWGMHEFNIVLQSINFQPLGYVLFWVRAWLSSVHFNIILHNFTLLLGYVGFHFFICGHHPPWNMENKDNIENTENTHTENTDNTKNTDPPREIRKIRIRKIRMIYKIRIIQIIWKTRKYG